MFALYPRLRGMGVVGYDAAPDKVQLIPDRLTAPLSWKKPRYVFVNSMSDVFHPDVPFEYVYEMFAVMDEAASLNGHVFQILTKRPGRAVGWWNEYKDQFPNGWHPQYLDRHICRKSEIRAKADGVGATACAYSLCVGGASSGAS